MLNAPIGLPDGSYQEPFTFNVGEFVAVNETQAPLQFKTPLVGLTVTEGGDEF